MIPNGSPFPARRRRIFNLFTNFDEKGLDNGTIIRYSNSRTTQTGNAFRFFFDLTSPNTYAERNTRLTTVCFSLLYVKAGEWLFSAGLDENIVADRAVKQPLDLLPVFCLPQYPHQFGYGGFGGHIVGFQYIQSGFQAVPHVIQ